MPTYSSSRISLMEPAVATAGERETGHAAFTPLIALRTFEVPGSSVLPAALAESVVQRMAEIELVGADDASFTKPLVHLVATSLVAGDMAPGVFTSTMKTLKRTRVDVDAHGETQERIYQALSVAILCLRHPQGKITEGAIARMQSTYDLMRHRRWWITIPQDLPLAALLGTVNAPSHSMDADCERTFLELTNSGHPVGLSVQVASNILCIIGVSQEAALDRFLRLAEVFRVPGSMLQPQPADLALLCLLDCDPALIARCYQFIYPRTRDNRCVTRSSPSQLLPTVASIFMALLPTDRSLAGLSLRAGLLRQQHLHRNFMASLCVAAITTDRIV